MYAAPNLFKVYIISGLMIVAEEEATQKVQVGQEEVSELLMFADDFVGVSDAPEGLKKEKVKALENTREWESDRSAQ